MNGKLDEIEEKMGVNMQQVRLKKTGMGGSMSKMSGTGMSNMNGTGMSNMSGSGMTGMNNYNGDDIN